MRFKISVARTAGFCFGVRRALDKTLEILNERDENVRTLGPLIHNEQVLDILKLRGVSVLNDGEDVTGKTIIIRAHGVTPDSLKDLKAKNANVCNATCPKVSHVQSIVKKYARRGYDIVIVGDDGHAEVEGLLGYAEGKGLVVSGHEQARALGSFDKVCVVAQTTQDSVTFRKTVNVIESISKTCLVFDTICSATADRQQEVLEMAHQSDLMIIVGGASSANTRRLADIAKDHCRTLLIQSPEELSRDMLQGVRAIGVTAGASTPSWVIRQVIDRIHEIGWSMAVFPLAYLHLIVKFLLRTNLAFSIAMALLVSSACHLLAIPPRFDLYLIGFWFAFYWSILADIFPTEHSPVRFYSRRNPFLEYPLRWIGVTVLLTIVVLLTAGLSSFKTLFWVLSFMMGGFLFSCPIPCILGKFGIARIRDYPFIKDAWFAIFASAMIVLFPWSSTNQSFLHPIPITLFVYYFILMWSRSVMLDIRDHQFDLVYGRKTLPIRIGKSHTHLIFGFAITIWILLASLPVWLNLTPILYVWMILVPIYFSVYLVLYHQRLMFLRLTSDAAVDSVLWLAIIIPYLTRNLN